MRWLGPLPSHCHKVNGRRPLGERLERKILSQTEIDSIRSMVGKGGDNIMPPEARESHLKGRPRKRKREIKLLLEGKMKVKTQALVIDKPRTCWTSYLSTGAT